LPNSESILNKRGDGVLTDAIEAVTVKVIVASISFLLRKSGSRLNFAKKSAPIIGLLTAAKTNKCFKTRRSPNSTSKNLVLYVLIFVPFAADKMHSGSLLILPKKLCGITEISAPVSTRKVNLVFGS
jgi:hypothetical protein